MTALVAFAIVNALPGPDDTAPARSEPTVVSALQPPPRPPERADNGDLKPLPGSENQRADARRDLAAFLRLYRRWQAARTLTDAQRATLQRASSADVAALFAHQPAPAAGMPPPPLAKIKRIDLRGPTVDDSAIYAQVRVRIGDRDDTWGMRLALDHNGRWAVQAIGLQAQ